MKKSLVFLCSFALMASLAACSTNDALPVNDAAGSASQNAVEKSNDTKEDQKKDAPATPVEASSLDNLEAEITAYVDGQVAQMKADYDTLVAKIDGYDAYTANVEQVQGYYDQVLAGTSDICLQLRQYAIDYANLAGSLDEDFDDQYDNLEGIYDVIYEDAADAVYDGIYEDLSSDLYDQFYDGVVSDGYDLAPYDEWSDVSSDAYDMWSDTMSDVYDEWSDAKSDIYDFYSDVRSDLYDNDSEEFDEHVAEFQSDVDALKQEAA